MKNKSIWPQKVKLCMAKYIINRQKTNPKFSMKIKLKSYDEGLIFPANLKRNKKKASQIS